MVVAIVDVIDRKKRGRVFRLVASIRGKDGQYNHKRIQLEEKDLVNDLSLGKYKLINGKLEGGEIKASAGDFSRFNNGINKPLVVIGEIVDNKALTLGYKLANCDGSVVTKSLPTVIDYCERTTRNEGIPLQNGIYVPAADGQKAFIRSYPNAGFPKEIHASRTSHNTRPTYVDKQAGERNISRLEQLFSKEQIEQLKLGKQNGMDIRIIANNKLSPRQMAIIRKCEENGLAGRLFANPDYSLDCMLFLMAELRTGGDIRPLLNTKYNEDQMFELSIARDLGLPTSEMDDPSLSAHEMSERRIRLANGMWKRHEVVTEGSWG